MPLPCPLVLVVDDRALVRARLTRLFCGAGYGVRSAADGVEALGVIEELSAPPSAIVCDVSMPVMDGPLLLEALRMMPQGLHEQLVFHTAEPELVPSGHRFLQKGCPDAEMLAVVGAIVAKNVAG